MNVYVYNNTEELINQETESMADVLNILPMFTLCGSRRIKVNNPNSDWDFFGADRPENRILLEKLGFIDKYGTVQHDYFDLTTTAVYVLPSSGGGFADLQVVLKKPEWIPTINRFWRYMANRPDKFRECFWKSYEVDGEKPNSSEKIKERIEHWMKYVMDDIEV